MDHPFFLQSTENNFKYPSFYFEKELHFNKINPDEKH